METPNQNSQNNQNEKFISAPYIKGVSERTSRIFKNYGVKMSHKPTKSLKNQLCHLKDKRKNQEKSGVIYKLCCNNCDAVYVGETGRQVQDRMQEHMKDVENKKINSNVSMHVQTTGHSFDFQNVAVLDSCTSTKVRKHLESVHTNLQSNPINRSITLNENYVGVLRNIR